MKEGNNRSSGSAELEVGAIKPFARSSAVCSSSRLAADRAVKVRPLSSSLHYTLDLPSFFFSSLITSIICWRPLSTSHLSYKLNICQQSVLPLYLCIRFTCLLEKFHSGKLGYSDDYRGTIHTRDHEMSNNPGPQNTF